MRAALLAAAFAALLGAASASAATGIPTPSRGSTAAAAGSALASPVAATIAAATEPVASATTGPSLHHLIGFRVLYRDLLQRREALVRRLWMPYRAWNGAERMALLVLPAWYGPELDPSIPLVISPHGRGGSARGNAGYWGGLPAFGPFALVNPQGQGRRLTADSWGWRGQIDDLARMPRILERALPWLHIDRSRIYAVGSSMGGQETLLLDALHPRLLAGAIALDSATDMAARYRAFATLPGGKALQARARLEIGGTPASDPAAYAARSPITYVRALATDGVPLSIWWSTRDRIVVDQSMESGRLYRAIKRVDPRAPVYQYVGSWAHSAEMHPTAQLPLALVELGLIQLDGPLPAAVSPERLALDDTGADPNSFVVPVRIPAAIDAQGGAGSERAVAAALRIPAGAALAVPALRPALPHLRV
jgi:poly(3-hydroxybutyrate) depolymerase